MRAGARPCFRVSGDWSSRLKGTGGNAPGASYSHRPQPEREENLRLMRLINETYLAFPCCCGQAANEGT